MTSYLLDTNHLSAAVRPGSPVRREIRRLKAQGERFGTLVAALCELEVGIRQVRNPQLYRKLLGRFLAEIRTWPIDLETAQMYGAIYHRLRRQGRVLSQVDMMLAAFCSQGKLTLLTNDRDFEALPELRTEDWTESGG
jgi:tRNA(fMet)-specific endonuclease VapC